MSQSTIVSGGLAIAGAFVGYYASGFSPYGAVQGAAIGWSIGSAVGIGLADKPETGEPKAEDDEGVQGDEGVPIPRCYGQGLIGMNCIYAGRMKTDREQKTKGGNKTVTFRYHRNIAWAACQGPLNDLGTILSGADKVGETGTVYLGTEIQTASSIIEGDSYIGTGNVPGFRGIAYKSYDDFNLDAVGGRFSSMKAEVKTTSSGTVPLSDVILAEVALCGLTAGDMDVSELTGIDVKWFNVARLTTIKDVLQELQSAYFFDVKDSGDKLVCQLRSNHVGVVADIPEEDLIRQASGADSALVSITQIPEIELPKKVELRYLDETSPYDDRVKQASKVDTDSNETRAVSLNMRFSATEAQQIADRLLAQYWEERYKISFQTSYKYVWLEPCDVITVTADGVQYKVFITKVVYNYYVNLTFEGVLYQGTAVSVNSGMTGGGTTWTPVEITASNPDLIIMDIPALNEEQLEKNMLVGLSLSEDYWMGEADIYKGLTAGTLDVVSSTSWLMTYGVTVNELAAGPTTRWDEVNYIEFDLTYGEMLGSVSKAAIEGSFTKRLWLVGEELIQARTEVLISGGRWRLSGLLRGRRGTEYQVGNHAIGDRVVLLEDEGYERIGMEILNQSNYWLAVNTEIEPNTGDAVSVYYTGQSVAHFSPAGLTYTEDATNIVLEWTYRNRRLLIWSDYTDIPEELDSMGYLVLATQAPSASYQQVVATETVTISKASMTGFNMSAPFTFYVYSLGQYRPGIPASIVRTV